jgi:SAM-dependent methyltransferase
MLPMLSAFDSPGAEVGAARQSTPMITSQEVQRLKQVYRNYRESESTQARWSDVHPGNEAIRREWTQVLIQMLRAAGFLPLAHRRILDVGCGSGSKLARFEEWGASPGELRGVDLLQDRIEEARQRHPSIRFQQGNAEQLEFADESFDLVLLFTVFTSILSDCMARNVASEVRRVLKPSGAVVWYDFRYNNPCNRNVRAMTAAAVRTLFPEYHLDLRAVTLLPPLARRLGAATHVLYPALSRICLLRTHYLGLLTRPA